MVEDCAPADRIRHLEIETANLRLVQQMAERLAHEIGNAVVPISTHQQLLKERIGDPDFQESLAAAMEEGVKRVSRLVDQMRFLARDRVGKMESVPVKQLIEEAFREARAYHPSTTVLLQFESSGEPLSVSCDRQGLQHAFAEIILNALQANTPILPGAGPHPHGNRFQRLALGADRSAGQRRRLQRRGRGQGLRAVFHHAQSRPGPGPGRDQQIIQTHCGKMEIPPPRLGSPGLVRVSLPLEPALPGN